MSDKNKERRRFISSHDKAKARFLAVPSGKSQIPRGLSACLNLWRVACNSYSEGFDIMNFVLIVFAFISVAFVAVWYDRPHK
jgi:hypothetical protein